MSRFGTRAATPGLGGRAELPASSSCTVWRGFGRRTGVKLGVSEACGGARLAVERPSSGSPKCDCSSRDRARRWGGCLSGGSRALLSVACKLGIVLVVTTQNNIVQEHMEENPYQLCV